MTPSRRVVLALLTVSSLLIPSLAAAQSAEEDRWAAPVSADHPGFSDSSITLPRRAYQVEVGLEGTKVAGDGPFNAGANVLGRFGLFDGLELRAKVPQVGAALDLEGRAGAQLLFERFEVGAKWSLATGGFSLALIPMVALPTTLVNSSFQFGASLGASADITLAPGVGLNVYAAPAFASNEALQDASDGTYLGADVATGVTLSLDPQLSVFVEAWANLTFVDPIQGADGSAVSPAGNAGLVYLISPDMLADAYFGVQLPGGQVTPYGGLGFTLLVR